MNDNQKCPHCGGKAHEISRHAKRVDLSEIAFRCTNPDCMSTFTGVLTLSRVATPGSQHFGCQAIHTDC